MRRWLSLRPTLIGCSNGLVRVHVRAQRMPTSVLADDAS